MPRHILVVCVGNICRSPMAAAMLSAATDDQLQVSSAGIGAVVGAPADPTACELMREQGLNLDTHTGQQLTADMVMGSDLVITMEQDQARWIEEHWPQSRGRVFRWGHWQDFDIPDPYRQDKQAFIEALQLIDKGLPEWVRRLEQISRGKAS